jgi:1,4-dihydroxy-2-naphthoate polyprenyltransferase
MQIINNYIGSGKESNMNIQMWGKALKGIIRLDKNEWQKLDIISRWLIATRAVVLIMTFLSAAFAGILAYRDGQFIWWRWVLLAIGLIFAHATNNIINDITDSKKGVDKDNYFRTQYGLQPMEMGLLSEKQMWTYAAVTGLIALAAGLPLVLLNGLFAWILLGLGVIFVLFYTYPLKYIGLGEIAVILVWGPLMIGGGYFVITGAWSWQVAIASLPYALGTTMVIFGKHIDKLDADKAKGIHTLPVLMGEKAARYFTLAMMTLQYLLVVYLVITRFFSPVLLLVFLAITTVPLVWKVYKAPKPKERPDWFPENTWPLYFVAMGFLHNRQFGIWYLLGMIVDVAIRALGFIK